MSERRALVVGSQCGGLPNSPLSFLPEAATELFEVLVDPERGSCQRKHSRLVIDPDLQGLVAAVGDAVAAADAAGDTLLLVFVGHAESVDGDLYLLATDGTSPPSMDSGFLFGQRLKELVGQFSGLDGLIVVVDACQSGVGVADVALRAGAGIAALGIRVQLVTSTFDRAARDGCFTTTLTRVLREGVPGLSRDYLRADEAVLGRVAQQCKAQDQPRAVTFQGHWPVDDPGLFLARNTPGSWLLAGTAAGGQAVDLTEHFQVPDALEAVAREWRSHQVVLVDGSPGSGKSAIVAALTRPEVAPDIVSRGFMAGVVFAETSPNVLAVAEDLARQLTLLEGFAHAAEEYRSGFDEQQLNGQDALTRLVMGPLRQLGVTGFRRVRLGVDGLDQFEDADRAVLFNAFRAMVGEPDLTGVRVVLAGRSGSLPDLGPAQSVVTAGGALSAKQVAAYLSMRQLGDDAVPAILEHAGSWLDVRLLADLAVPLQGLILNDESGTRRTTLSGIYDAAVAVARERAANSESVDISLEVLRAAGSGPVLPLGLFVDALSEAKMGRTDARGRDLLVQLGGLVVRSKPGTAEEQVGLVHDTLLDHLLRVHNGAASADTDQGARGHRWILTVLEQDDATAAPRYSSYARAAKAEHLWAIGRTGEALDWVLQSLGVRPRDNVALLRPWLDRCFADLGTDHPDTLPTRSHLATWTGASGDPATARDLFTALLQDHERVLGPDHPHTLTTRIHLATWTGEAGNPTAARDLLTALLPDLARVLGPDHPHTRTSRGNLATWTGRAGDPAAGRGLFTALLPELARVLGPDHPDTITARGNLASLTGDAGDPAAARDLFTALLPDRTRVVGRHHPNTLTSRGNLATWTGRAGDPAAARDLFTALLPELARVLGPDHPDTLTTRSNLASWTGEAGDPAAARDLFTALLRDRTRALGRHHPDTLTTRSNLAIWTGSAGDPAAARDLLTALLPDLARVLGPDHPNTLTIRSHLATWTGEAGDPAAARDLLRALVPYRTRVLGPDHPNTLTSQGNLAFWTGKAGDPAAARDLLTVLLLGLARVLGPDHPDTLTTRSNLATWTGEAGDPAAARDLLRVLLPNQERILGPDHLHTLIIRSHLATWTGEAGNPTAARDLLTALLPDLIRVLGPDHPHTLTTRKNLARWTGQA
jgi:hypothetical protein